MALRATPQEAGANLKLRISQSGTRYGAGIARVTENPAAKAIAANDKWVTGIQDAIANDRFRKGLSSVTLEFWKGRATKYGVPNYTASADKAGENYTRFAALFFPYLETGMAQVNSMPSNTFQDNLQRMIAMATYLHNFRNV